MGKKARKTRWRTLPIADEQSDSEESNTTTAPRLPQYYQQKSYYNKLPYSSQSTPRRRYQHDGTKSTRSSSTASENKITFNEDEYTRITTPRQDVLFKKGYLNKPRSYQTQTSTGTSTTSTGNSTGNGTPDHQLTDLDYESQFVFPNGFVDQNGIYYVNSFEPYPLMLYNPPTYYNEFSNCKSKRYSTGSLTESTSPHNEEATSQDLSGGEASNNVSDYSSHHSVYNMVYPGYYVNGVCHPQDVTEQCSADQIRKVKKRTRRKTSNSRMAQESTECSDEENDSYNENESPPESQIPPQSDIDPRIVKTLGKETNDERTANESRVVVNNEPKDEHQTSKYDCKEQNDDGGEKDNCEDSKDENHITNDDETNKNIEDHDTNLIDNNTANLPEECNSLHDHPRTQKYDLKPDAEEFIPRSYRTPEIPLSPVQFIKVSPNFVPIPMVPFNGQNFNTAFIPSGIPINFLPPDPKMFPNFVSFVPNVQNSKEEETEERRITIENSKENQNANLCQSSSARDQVVTNEEITESRVMNNKTIDLAKIVSKLEEAVKKQEEGKEIKTEKNAESTEFSDKKPSDKQPKVNQKYKNNHKRGFYNSPRSSPQRKFYQQRIEDSSRIPSTDNSHISDETDTSVTRTENNLLRNSPENKKTWKLHYQNSMTKWQHRGFHRSPECKTKQMKKNDSKSGLGAEMRQNNRDRSDNSTDVLSDQKLEKLHSIVTNLQKTHSSQTEASGLQIYPVKTPSPTKKSQNQWISVSSRKKRKNKNTEENETSFDDAEDEHSLRDDLFESYDVNQLVDVVPTSIEEDNVEVEINEVKVQDIFNIISQTEPAITENIHLIPTMKSVSEIESGLLVSGNEHPEETGQSKAAEESEDSGLFGESEQHEESQLLKDERVDVPKLSETKSVLKVIEEPSPNKIKNKKKSKKATQKPLMKRVIITDIDLSEKCEEIKSPVKKIVKKIERTGDKHEETIKSDEKFVEVIKHEEPDVTVDESPIKIIEDVKMSSKKKKKKNIKSATISIADSSSCAAAQLNLVESLDYLLESNLTGESDKTNDDIFQELDKMIQKGMYSSLEGKIKSLNINESDGFFKSVFSKISSRETSVEKTGYSKSPDFSKIPLFMPVSVSEATSLDNMKANKKLPALESPDEDGFFLENPDLRQILDDRSMAKEETKAGDEDDVEERMGEQKTLYPITEAVKEWMSKTRETTPDAEILKSPKTIYKEFCGSAGSDKDTEVHISQELSGIPLSANTDDDEITIFSTENNLFRRDSEEQDLLEYWEDEVKNPNGDEKNKNNDVEEVISGVNRGQDVLEVYESKYGKNEDYLNLQREIKEKSNNSRYPKHGNLPYRAICCNIM